jgi:hypothetical protein
VTGKDGVAPTPLQVKYYAPDDQSDDWYENDQQNDHHNLLPEVFSAYASKRVCGYERCLDYLHRHEIPEVAAADEVPFVHDGGTIVIAQRAPVRS